MGSYQLRIALLATITSLSACGDETGGTSSGPQTAFGALATDIYVDRDRCESSSPDGSVRSPFCRITDALDRARELRESTQDRIRILIGPGVYSGDYPDHADSEDEEFPLWLNVPRLSVIGSTEFTYDAQGRPLEEVESTATYIQFSGDSFDQTTGTPFTRGEAFMIGSARELRLEGLVFDGMENCANGGAVGYAIEAQGSDLTVYRVKFANILAAAHVSATDSIVEQSVFANICGAGWCTNGAGTHQVVRSNFTENRFANLATAHRSVDPFDSGANGSFDTVIGELPSTLEDEGFANRCSAPAAGAETHRLIVLNNLYQNNAFDVALRPTRTGQCTPVGGDLESRIDAFVGENDFSGSGSYLSIWTNPLPTVHAVSHLSGSVNVTTWGNEFAGDEATTVWVSTGALCETADGLFMQDTVVDFNSLDDDLDASDFVLNDPAEVELVGELNNQVTLNGTTFDTTGFDAEGDPDSAPCNN